MGSPDLFFASCEQVDVRSGEAVGLICTIRSIRVLTKWGLVLLEVVPHSPEASANYPQGRAGQGSGLEKPICRTPERNSSSDERHSGGLFWNVSCKESILPGAQQVSGSPLSMAE